MKATGIVRRIDDLGRVVIPKEIRRTMRIREGDPLEIYTDKDGGVIFKKYSLMGGLVDFAGQLEEIDTEGISPMAHVLPVQNAFREDVVQPSFDRAALLANAPSAEEGCLSVPRVVE